MKRSQISLSACHPVPLSSAHRRGAALIITIWVLIALAGLALALAHAVGVEAVAAVDRAGATDADFAEQGAEQFALSAVDDEVAVPGDTTWNPNIQQMMGDPTDPDGGMIIGKCRVWIIKPDPDDETALAFGLTDEASKLDINYATEAQLMLLPNFTQENADCILDWRNLASNPSSQGAESSYYTGLPDPYNCKNLPFETVEELNLVKSILTDDSGAATNLMYGLDTTHSGRVPADAGGSNNLMGQQSGAQSLTAGSLGGTTTSDRGVFPFITVYGLLASTVPPPPTSTGLTTTGLSATTIADVNSQDQTNLRAVLTKYLTGGNVNQVLSLTAARLGGGGGKGAAAAGRFDSIFDWAVSVNLTQQQFSSVFHYVKASAGQTVISGSSAGGSTTPANPEININTAPYQVLMTLPSIADADAQAIIAYLENNPQPADPTDISWMLNVVPKAKLTVIGKYITGMSYCYSADIVAATMDGRAFKRVRIVIDASSGTSKIIYRRDLTSLGWPLPPEFRPDPKDPNNQ